MLKHFLVASSAFVLSLAPGLVVQAQTPNPAPQSQPSGQGTSQPTVGAPVTSEELQKFAKSFKQVQTIQEQTMAEMLKAVRSEGLSEQRFVAIYRSQQNSQSRPESAVTTQERQQFAQVLKKLGEIEQRTQTQMQQAIRTEGLEPDRFVQILAAVRRDSALQQQMQKLLQQSSLLNKYAATDAVPVVKLGSTGAVVADIQKFLKQEGFYEGAIDGTFGSESQVAVKKFQEQANLPTDGIVGAKTWQAMVRSSLG